MKRMVVLALAVAILCAPWGCSGEKKEAAAPPEPPKEAYNPYAPHVAALKKAKELQQKSRDVEAARQEDMRRLAEEP